MNFVKILLLCIFSVVLQRNFGRKLYNYVPYRLSSYSTDSNFVKERKPVLYPGKVLQHENQLKQYSKNSAGSEEFQKKFPENEINTSVLNSLDLKTSETQVGDHLIRVTSKKESKNLVSAPKNGGYDIHINPKYSHIIEIIHRGNNLEKPKPTLTNATSEKKQPIDLKTPDSEETIETILSENSDEFGEIDQSSQNFEEGQEDFYEPAEEKLKESDETDSDIENFESEEDDSQGFEKSDQDMEEFESSEEDQEESEDDVERIESGETLQEFDETERDVEESESLEDDAEDYPNELEAVNGDYLEESESLEEDDAEDYPNELEAVNEDDLEEYDTEENFEELNEIDEKDTEEVEEDIEESEDGELDTENFGDDVEKNVDGNESVREDFEDESVATVIALPNASENSNVGASNTKRNETSNEPIPSDKGSSFNEEFEGSGEEFVDTNNPNTKTGRILGMLSRRNETFPTCTTQRGEPGHCRRLNECLLSEALSNFNGFLQQLCLIRGVLVGICCPDNPVIETVNPDDNITSELSAEEIEQPPEGCGLNTKTRIVGGTISVPHEWTWMVALMRRNRFYCGGVIINNWYILTAAHCVMGMNVKDLTVRLGEYDFNEQSKHTEDLSVSEIKRHAQFVTITFQHDIALLKLKRSIKYSKFVGSICLPEQKARDYSDVKGTVVGWGTVSFGGAASPVLRQVTVPVWKNEDCDRTYLLESIGDSFMCAGAPEKGEDACQGDSGGPLMTLNEKGRWEVIGLVSWGRRCGDPTYPGVYTRITTYLDWIKQNAV